MSKEDAFLGYPISFKDICFVYPPFNDDIIKAGFDKFSIYVNLLTKSQEDIEDEMEINKDTEIPTPFDFIMGLSKLSNQIETMYKEAFTFFTHEKITILYELNLMVVGSPKEKRIINKDNFFEFQNIIRQSMGFTPIEQIELEINPKVRRFKALARKRDRVKAKQNKGESKEFLTLLTSVCCIGAGVTPFNVGKLTYAATNLLIERYVEKDSYETRVASQLAGSDSKNDSYWIKDIKN